MWLLHVLPNFYDADTKHINGGRDRLLAAAASELAFTPWKRKVVSASTWNAMHIFSLFGSAK